MKAAPVSRALRVRHEERLVHSGQHWDDALSRVFFEELALPAPDIHLAASHMATAPRLAHMVRGISDDVVSFAPDVVMAYGDTDTTLAAALAARGAGVPLAHVEAGLRSGRLRMPEEINRIAVDHLSAALLCPTESAAATLRAEHAAGSISVVGDVMLDALLDMSPAPGEAAAQRLGCEPGTYVVATVHRASNTDDPARLLALLGALAELDVDVVLPCHPRTRAAIDALGAAFEPGRATRLRILPPVGRIAMIGLVRGARGVLTDSGGLQKEAWFLGIPCVTLRDETEWTETLAGGWNVLVGSDRSRIADAVDRLGDARPVRDLEIFGAGHAAERTVAAIELAVSDVRGRS